MNVDPLEVALYSGPSNDLVVVLLLSQRAVKCKSLQ
jgi:hypothetical protein